jgi:hypothetical protein
MGNTPIVSHHTGPKQALLDFAKDQKSTRMNEVVAFLDELFAQNVLDGFMIGVQACVECNNWRSTYWTNRLNAGAIGLLGGPGGGIDEDQGFSWKNGQEAARAMMIHHIAYLGIPIPKGWESWVALDPRYQIARDSWGGQVKKWSDYGNYKWAADPRYYEAIIARENWVRQFQTDPNPKPNPDPVDVTGTDLVEWLRPYMNKVPYVYGGHSTKGWDCSNMISVAMEALTGKEFPRDSHVQYTLGTAVDRKDWQPGDILCWDTMNGTEVRNGNACSHVGVYSGNNKMMNALNPSMGTQESDLTSNYWQNDVKYLGARRVLPTGDPTPKPDNRPKKPNIIDKWLQVQHYIPNRRGKKPGYGVLHIQEGTNAGSWSHFHNVKASSTVLIGRNGDVWRIVEEKHGPWTNGDVNRPTAKALNGILRETNDPNELSLTIETEGYTYAPNAMGWRAGEHPQAQVDAIVWVFLDWMDRYPDMTVDDILRHADINSVSRNFCPGNALYDTVIARVKGADVPPPPPDPLLPLPVVGFDGTKDMVVNNSLWHAQKQTVTARSGGDKRQWAGTQSGVISSFSRGDTIPVLGWVFGEEVSGEKRWWLAADWTRIWVGFTAEEPNLPRIVLPVLPNGEPDDRPDVPDFPNAPTVINGHAFYPMGEGNGRKIKLLNDANLRKYADTSSEIVGSVNQNEEVVVYYWVKGEEIDNEYVWYILKSETDDPFAGPRLWSGATNSRPF